MWYNYIFFFKNKDYFGVSVENGLKGWEIGNWKIILEVDVYNSFFFLGNKFIYFLVRFKLGIKGGVFFFYEKLKMKVEMFYYNERFNWNFLWLG